MNTYVAVMTFKDVQDKKVIFRIKDVKRNATEDQFSTFMDYLISSKILGGADLKKKVSCNIEIADVEDVKMV